MHGENCSQDVTWAYSIQSLRMLLLLLLLLQTYELGVLLLLLHSIVWWCFSHYR
jgi:hypothetical protein